MTQSWTWWLGFNSLVLAMLAVDLGVFQRRAHGVRFREALAWSMVWIAAALLFALGLWLGWLGEYLAADRPRITLEFLAGYLIEKSLSVDNLFVFAVIFNYFAVPTAHQHRVLFFGILGALLFRALFIFGGLWLVQKFTWMVYVFGLFLIFAGLKLAIAKDKEAAPQRNPLLRLARATLPVTSDYVDGRFFVRADRRWLATPLLLVLLLIETTDIVFAVDSIPAVIAITKDPFVVYTSNVLAILGLRALYFVLAVFLRMFRYLSYGLAVLLVFTGLKMLAEPLFGFHMSPGLSLVIIGSILAITVVWSLLAPSAPRPAARPAGLRAGGDKR